MPRTPQNQPGFTLLELLVTLAFAGLLCAIAVPRFLHVRHSLAVRAATNDATTLFASARTLALTRGTRIQLHIDTAQSAITLTAGNDTITHHPAGQRHGTTLHTTRTHVTYAPTGLTLGLANLTLIIAKGSVADTLTLSRLGRLKP